MFSADKTFMLNELGAIITEKEKTLTVERIPPKQSRPKEAQDIDLQKGDIVLMANGKRVKTISDLRATYEKTTISDDFKMGVKRGENQFIISVKKKSEEELAKAGGPMRRIMKSNDGDEILPALGLIISEKEKKVFVSKSLPNASENFKEFTPQENDIIASINAKPVTSAKEFVGAYDALETGAQVTIELIRKEKSATVTIAKPKPQGKMIIHK
jgi:S1-C subfamily serine protease